MAKQAVYMVTTVLKSDSDIRGNDRCSRIAGNSVNTLCRRNAKLLTVKQMVKFT
jgi:hypothetical protein